MKDRINKCTIALLSVITVCLLAMPAMADYTLDEVTNADIPVSGTMIGSHLDTHTSNDEYEAITEVLSTGNPAKNRYSYLEHKWTVNVTGGDSVTFYLEAYRSSSSDGDDFVFAYSTDDNTYTDMVTVTKTSDDDTYQTFDLPGDLSGPVYIRVMDTDRTAGNQDLDAIHIDHLFIRSKSGPPSYGVTVTIDEASQIVAPGDGTTYTVRVKNTGDLNASYSAVISGTAVDETTIGVDPLNWNTGTLAPNAEYVQTVTFSTTSSTPETTYTLTATATCVEDASVTDAATSELMVSSAGYTDDKANEDTPVTGTVSGSYLDTHESDDVYESITEVLSTGNPAKNQYSYLEHKWTVDVTGGSEITFYLEAYQSQSSDGDDFVFAYSIDDSTYTDIVTVTKTADDDTYQTYGLPGDLSGPVYIRVMDTDRTAGNQDLDAIYIDHLFIRSESGPPSYGVTVTIDEASQIVAPGDGTTYTVRVKNTGDLNASYSAVISGTAVDETTIGVDPLNWNTGTLAPNAEYVQTVTFSTTSSTPETTYTLTATATCVEDASVTDAATSGLVVSSAGYTDDKANGDTPVAGTVSGSYLDTHESDDVYESITEILSTGNPTKNQYSYLEHKWTVDVTDGNNVTFYLEAYQSQSSDGDDFVFAYSTDDSTYTDMVAVTKTADDDTYQTYGLPGDLNGTVYIRVMDTDQTAGNQDLDTIHIDHMFITRKPDITITAINAYHNNTQFQAWFNLSNEIDVTVKNDGTVTAGASNVCLYIDDELFGKLHVSSLAASASETVTFENWKPIGFDCEDDGTPVTYTLKAIADCDNEIVELNEGNNNFVVNETVRWNGYTADEPLVTAAHGKLMGGLLFTTGNSVYGMLYTGQSRTAQYDIDLPGSAHIELARLNVYYTWTQPEGTLPAMEVSITNQTGTYVLPLDVSYNDRKCFGDTYDYYWGNYVYDLTDYVRESGTYNVTLTNIGTAGHMFAPAGPGIEVVYSDPSKPLIEYWIDEGADVLIGGQRDDGGYLSLEECINNATFAGSINLSEVDRAVLGVVSPWGDAAPNDVLYFNGIEIGGGVYENGYGPIGDRSIGGIRMTGTNWAQVGVNLSDVTDHLDANVNVAGQGDDGDNMMPSNAFLVIDYGREKPEPAFLIPFLISGFVDSEGTPVNDPAVTIENMGTGEVFTVETSTSSNYYQTLITLESVNAGDVLRFTCGETSVDHEVSHEDMAAGAIEQNISLATSPDDFWVSDSAIVSGLGDIGDWAAPAVFNRNGTWYLISGEHEGAFYGFSWNGSAWNPDTTIASGLSDVGNDSTPTVFNKDGTWYLIAGEYDGTFNGFEWSGSAWVSDGGIVSGLSDLGNNSASAVFNKDGTWYLIAGEYDGAFNGFKWSGSAWVSDSTITSGLGDIGSQSAPNVFNKNGIWYMIAGEYDIEPNGFRWSETDSAWQPDAEIISGLEGNIAICMTPAVFDKDGTWYLISGKKFGEFYGFKENLG